MNKIPITKVTKLLGKPLKQGIRVLGLDTASRTGWALLKVTKTHVTIETGYVMSRHTGEEKYDDLLELFLNLLLTNDIDCVIIEDTYLGFGMRRNPNAFKVISRIGMIAYAISYYCSMSNKFIMATQARAAVGLKGNAKKEEIIKYLNMYLGLKLDDHDIADAVVLALNGVIDEEAKEDNTA